MTAKEKAIKVMRSCKTMYHIPMARRFAKLAGLTDDEIKQLVPVLLSGDKFTIRGLKRRQRPSKDGVWWFIDKKDKSEFKEVAFTVIDSGK